MKQSPLSLRIIGCPGSGQRTVAGCLLYKFNGVSLPSLEKLRAQGINNYGQVVEGLLSQGVQLKFETPRHLVSIIDPKLTSTVPDIWLVVISSGDDVTKLVETLELPSQAKVIVLVSKMDNEEWSEEVFESKVLQTSKLVQNAMYIPCSGLSGDNFVDLSSKSPWYAGRFGSTGGTIPEPGTLLAAIDQMFSSQ